MGDVRGRMGKPRVVGDLLADVLRGKPAERRLKEGRIWLFWDEAVGERIAARARPVAFRDGTLTLAVASAPWMQQLSFLKGEITDRLNSLLGEPVVRDIYLKAGHIAPPAQDRDTPFRPSRELSSAEERFIEDTTEQMDDEELREALASLMQRHYCSDVE
ncbi:hypothetical protein YM18_0620 [Geobacter sulfurreducens]|nr:hypothetical protein YM18_0620 [Geobacter sulfurreducens]